jgi:NitT/TauT family transport system substrate-binding protein
MHTLLRWLALLGLASLVLSACGVAKTPAAPLLLALNTWPGHAPFYVASKRQLYASTQVEIKTFSSIYDMERAFSQKRIDAVGTTLFAALRMADEGVPLKIVMFIDYSNGADGIVARRGITSLRELKGKRVAAEVGAISHFILLAALDRAGLQETDVELVNLSVEEGAKALAEGKVDAAALWEPLLSEQANRDGATKLFTSAEIPGQVLDVLAVQKDVAEQRPDDVVNLIRGWEHALQLVHTQPQDAMPIMAEAQQTTPDALQRDLSSLELFDLAHSRQFFDLANQDQSIGKTYTATAQFMIQHHLLGKPAPAVQDLVDSQFVEAAVK